MSNAYCSYCGKDHPRSLCPHTYVGSSRRHHLWCSYCGSKQHTKEYCPDTYCGDSNRRNNPDGEYLDR